jgi:hypothetical protein
VPTPREHTADTDDELNLPFLERQSLLVRFRLVPRGRVAMTREMREATRVVTPRPPDRPCRRHRPTGSRWARTAGTSDGHLFFLESTLNRSDPPETALINRFITLQQCPEQWLDVSIALIPKSDGATGRPSCWQVSYVPAERVAVGSSGRPPTQLRQLKLMFGPHLPTGADGLGTRPMGRYQGSVSFFSTFRLMVGWPPCRRAQWGTQIGPQENRGRRRDCRIRD